MIEGLRPSWQTHVLIGRGEIFREYKVDGKAFSSNAIAQLLWQDPSCRAWCECYTCRCKCGVLGSQTTVHPSGHRLEKVKHIDTYFWPTDELLSKWESHLVDSAVGFQSQWGFRAVGVWHNSGEITSPCAVVSQCTEGWSQYFPPPAGCCEISWYRELAFKMYSLLTSVWIHCRSKLYLWQVSHRTLALSKTLLEKSLSISVMVKDTSLWVPHQNHGGASNIPGRRGRWYPHPAAHFSPA